MTRSKHDRLGAVAARKGVTLNELLLGVLRSHPESADDFVEGLYAELDLSVRNVQDEVLPVTQTRAQMVNSAQAHQRSAHAIHRQ